MMIRLAKEKDLERIGELLYEVHHLHATIRPDLFIDKKRKYSLDDLKKLIKREDVYIYVFDDDVKGYVISYLQNSKSESVKPLKTLFIDDLCVDINYRHQGIGKKLLDYVEEQAKILGCNYLTLNVWEGNDNAINFYKKNDLKVREYVMEKKL